MSGWILFLLLYVEHIFLIYSNECNGPTYIYNIGAVATIIVTKVVFACSTKIHFPFSFRCLLPQTMHTCQMKYTVLQSPKLQQCNLLPNFCSSFVCQFNLGSWIIKVPSYTLIYIDTYLAIRCISVSNKSKFGLFIARIRNCNSKLHLGCRQSLYHQSMW